MKSNRNFCFSFLFCFASMLFLWLPYASAKRLAITELTYQHLSGNSYRFHCVYYMYCDGLVAPVSLTMNAASTSCGVNLTYALNMVDPSGTEITKHCDLVTSMC